MSLLCDWFLVLALLRGGEIPGFIVLLVYCFLTAPELETSPSVGRKTSVAEGGAETERMCLDRHIRHPCFDVVDAFIDAFGGSFVDALLYMPSVRGRFRVLASVSGPVHVAAWSRGSLLLSTYRAVTTSIMRVCP